jgi:two-component system NtrC family sensor kinase
MDPASIDQAFNRLYEQVVKAKVDWQDTFDSIPDLICILDKEARIIRVNRAFSTRLQKPYDALIGVSFTDVIHASPMPAFLKALTSAVTAGQHAHQEQEIDIDGSLFAAALFPCYDTAGDFRGTVCIFRDITEQKRLKDHLVQSEKMAAIGTLAAEIAHEMNNPLHYINNYLYLLFESLPADFAKKEYVEKIQTGIDNLAQLTRDLLEFSRPLNDVFTPVNPHHIIESSVERLEQHISDSRVQIIRRYGCPDNPVLGSDRMLQQVFVNLIQNALDALSPGGRMVLTTTCDQHRFVAEIEDSGAGIDAKNISKIFEPFFTTKKSMERRGTGLGLTICYNIIKQHNGDIAVTSKAGQGTTFRITLPIAPSQ